MTPEALAAIHGAAFTETRSWSASEFADLLAQSGSVLTGDARSFVLGRVTLDEAEILTLATAPDQRRQGLASAALAAFEKRVSQLGAVSVFLEVAENNRAARSLYDRAGYIGSGRRPDYYATADGAKIAALVLRKSLDSRSQ